MESIDQIAELGIFKTNQDRIFSREFGIFNEDSAIQSFAEAINSGSLSVTDSFRNFWSYEEDKELWQLPEGEEWRAMLPDWSDMLKEIIIRLEDAKRTELAILLKGYHKKADYHINHIRRGRYNPFVVGSVLADHIMQNTVKGFDNKYLLKYHEGMCLPFLDTALFKEPEKPAIHYLRVIRSREDQEGLCYACFALGKIGDEAAVPDLISLARQPDSEGSFVREYVFQALARIGGEKAWDFFVSYVQDSSPHKWRYVYKFIELNAEGQKRMAPVMCDYLRRIADPLRYMEPKIDGEGFIVVRVLEQIGDRESLKALREFESYTTLGSSVGQAIPVMHHRLTPKGLIPPDSRAYR